MGDGLRFAQEHRSPHPTMLRNLALGRRNKVQS